MLGNDPERKLEERRKAREASRTNRAEETDTHTTAAAALDVSTARQARLDRLAAERKAEANAKRERQNSLLVQCDRAPSLPDESARDPENVEKDELMPAADRITGEAAHAMQLQKELDEMAHMLSVRGRTQRTATSTKLARICCVALSL